MTRTAEIARALFAAVQQTRHYGAGHPAAGRAASEFFGTMASDLAHAAVRIEVDERTVLVQAVSLPPEDRQVAQLHFHLVARRIRRVTVERDAGEGAIAALIRLLALEPEEIVAEGGFAEALRDAGVSGVTVQSGDMPAEAPPVPAQDSYAAAVRAAGEISASVEQGDPVDFPRALLTVEELAAALTVERERLWRSVADRGHDELDPRHAVNTSLLTLLMAEALGVPSQSMMDLGAAGLLHDIGLSVLPWEQQMLERTAAGPSAQWRHPTEGAFLLRHLGGRESLPMIVAAEHHLPALGEGSVLPHSRLVGLADYVDALTCGRVPAMRQTSADALVEQLLHGSGPAFDPVHVRVLADLLHRQEAAGTTFAAAV